jgi:hypothetical protein
LYKLHLDLQIQINDAADSVKFVKKKFTLKVKCSVLPPNSAAGPTASQPAPSANGFSSSAGPNAAAGGQQQQQQQQHQVQLERGYSEDVLEQQRKEQERRHNKEAAEEWLR